MFLHQSIMKKGRWKFTQKNMGRWGEKAFKKFIKHKVSFLSLASNWISDQFITIIDYEAPAVITLSNIDIINANERIKQSLFALK